MAAAPLTAAGLTLRAATAALARLRWIYNTANPRLTCSHARHALADTRDSQAAGTAQEDRHDSINPVRPVF
ncbi:hypothetical protein E2C01_063206 [Portunus trituberculatus]|uniref:Uncharacterized protein n=1 Tax=Portunus trituberculatus TaxID=210409 RepID=A0A5B7HFQ5_PORTR|nr:hypothetical protein [Portunus trituberculatus]